MQSYNILRKIGNIAFSAGNAVTLDLPRAYDYQTVFLRIAGNITATGAGGVVRSEAPAQIIQRAEIIADGKNTLVSIPFTLACLGNVWRPGLGSGARAITPMSSGAAGSYTVEAIAAIDFANVSGVRQKDTNYRTSGLALYQLRISFGQLADLYSTQPATSVTTTGLSVDVFSMETVEMPDAGGTYTMPLALKKVSYQEIAISATNANQEVRLPAGNLIRGCVIRATSGGEPVTTILNNLQLASGVDVRVNLSAAQLRAKNNLDYGFLTAGYYVVDIMTNGPANHKMTDAWDVTGQTEPKLILDVTTQATAILQIATPEFILAR